MLVLSFAVDAVVVLTLASLLRRPYLTRFCSSQAQLTQKPKPTPNAAPKAVSSTVQPKRTELKIEKRVAESMTTSRQVRA